MVLDEIFIKYGTDKGSLNGHDYAPFYEKHLPKSIGNFLEIGAWKGAGIKSFREWYDGKGKFYAMDRFIDGHGLITISELQAAGINAFQGDQKDLWFLETIKEQFSVIIDDASHLWADQIITFKRMFLHNIEPGGIYVIEDVFDEPYWGSGVINDCKDNIRNVFIKSMGDGNLVSQCFTQQESDLIVPHIEKVHIHDDIIFIQKKNNA